MRSIGMYKGKQINKPVIIGDATLYQGDCLEIMSTLGKVDAVVTDPPYKLTSGGNTFGGMNGGWMDDYSNNGSPVLCDVTWEQIMESLFAVCGENADVYVMANDKNVCEAGIKAKAAGFGFHNLLVWDKVNATANRWYMKNCEYILYLWKGRAAKIADPSSKQLIKCPQVDTSPHPTEKPVSLMSHYIKNSTDRGQLVIDPFMGSGTTGVACAKLGRKFIGIELEPKYFDIACERIQKAYDQPDMFVEQPKKLIQDKMGL